MIHTAKGQNMRVGSKKLLEAALKQCDEEQEYLQLVTRMVSRDGVDTLLKVFYV